MFTPQCERWVRIIKDSLSDGKVNEIKQIHRVGVVFKLAPSVSFIFLVTCKNAMRPVTQVTANKRFTNSFMV